MKPQEGEAVVTKTAINSFKGTDLEAKLKDAGVCSPRGGSLGPL